MDLAAGFEIGLATGFRYIREALEVLPVMGGRDRPFYSGKHKRHGVNVQALTNPAGQLIWTSPSYPMRATTWAPPWNTVCATRSKSLTYG